MLNIAKYLFFIYKKNALQKTLLLSFLIISYSGNCQFNPVEANKVLPPSPTVAELGRYGTASVNLSDGAANLNIPLYEYKTPNLKLPISLTYNSNGVKVDQIASRVGMGWMLHAGGVISRTVYGDPDEERTRLNPPSSINSPQSEWLSFVNNALSGAFDYQPDIFSFSFNGFSGKFTWDGGTPVKLEQNNLKISGSPIDGFTITTPDGVIYSFDVTESTVSINNCLGNNFDRTPVINAWYLSKIKHPKGDVIMLEYGANSFTYRANIMQTLSRAIPYSSEAHCSTCPESNLINECATDLKNNGVYLTKISSNKFGTVDFEYENRLDLTGDVCLKKINIKNNVSSVLKSFSLSYAYPTGNERLFLSTISEIKEGLNAIRKHTFDYNDINGLPPRLSFSKDDYGYFNGKNNSILIPKPNTHTELIQYYSQYNFADRSPDHFYGKKGLLTKITYPTGGSDEYYYEPHTIYSDYSNAGCNIDASVSFEGAGEFHKTITYESEPFQIDCSQITTINLSNVIDVEGYPPATYSVIAYVTDGTTNRYLSDAGSQIAAYMGEANVFYMTLSPGQYKVVLQVNGPCSGVGTIGFKKKKAGLNAEIAGSRVQKIVRRDSETSSQVIRYFYNEADGKSSGVVLEGNPYYESDNTKYSLCSSSGTNCVMQDCRYVNLSSVSNNDLNFCSGNHIYYATVTESFGENFENGGVEHTFYVDLDLPANPVLGGPIPGAPLTNYGILNGREVGRKTLRKSVNGLITIQELKNNFSYENSLAANKKYYVLRAHTQTPFVCFVGNSIYDLKGVDIAEYEYLSRWSRLESTIVTDYDFNGLNGVETKTTYDYTNVIHQQPTLVKKINSKNDVLSTKYDFPHEMVSTGQDPNLIYQEMVNQNMIGSPVITTEIKSTQPLTSTKVTFDKFSSIILPQSIEIKNEITAEKDQKIIYQKYDILGNPLTISNSQSLLTSYKWGYDQQYPVAECKNAAENEFYFESFEEDAAASIVKFHTGVKCNYGRNFTVSFTKPNSRIYTIGWFELEGTIWKYKEETYTGTKTFSATAYIDDIRIFPSDAQMTTYTYEPLVGMTSSTDAKGQTTYYVYDGFQRLKWIKDQYGNILKTMDYHYQNQ